MLLVALGCARIASAGRGPADAEPCPPSDTVLDSVARATEGMRAFTAGDFPLAIAKLGLAIELAPGNHTAWYYLGHAQARSERYDEAASSFAQAVALSDDGAMYHLWHGISLYKALAAEAKVRTGTDDVNALALGDELQPAADELEAALARNPGLFRAYYYLGRIRRHQADAAGAAEAFASAITHGPREIDPYIALGELYRRWDYPSEALQVLRQGALTARGGPTALAELRFALGMACDALGDDPCAIEAFTASLDHDDSLHKARYQRGISYFRIKDDARAKEDLEQFLDKVGDHGDIAIAVARQTLAAIAKRGRP